MARLRYRDLSIQSKLALLVLLSTLSALVIAATTMVTYDAYALRRALENEMTTTVDMMARSTTAALSFQDSKAATQALQTLRAKPSIAVAYILDVGGQVRRQLSVRSSPSLRSVTREG